MFTLILPTFSRPISANFPDLNTPALNQILRFGRWTRHDWTTGQLYLRHLCGGLSLPENEIFASPVWLQMGMNNMTMIDGASIQIGMGEAQSLCDGLNEFYRHEFVLAPIRADLWRFRLPEKPQWQSPMLFDAWGFQAGDLSEQASGQNRNAWLQLQTEIQMWLHAHPMNKVRQKNGQAPINGIWLWYAPPSEPLSQPPVLLGSNSVWARASTLPVHDAPYSFAVWQQICQEKNLPLDETALFLDDAVVSAQTGDEYAYAQTVQHWETHFFAPIWSALKSGKLPEMRLICEQGILHIKQRAHWAFWKANKRFTGLLE